MNTDDDPNFDEQSGGEIGRKFFIGTQELKPFSHGHKFAFHRLQDAVPCSTSEQDAAFLFLLTKSADEINRLRSKDDWMNFLMEMTTWANGYKHEQIFKAAQEVWDDYAKANSVEPAQIPSPPGNA